MNTKTILEQDKGYPWRASLTKKARCGMCEHLSCSDICDCHCDFEHEVIYPLLSGEHNCKDYEYEPDIIPSPPEGKIFRFNGHRGGADDMFPECKDCSHNFMGRCDGIKWIPIEKVNGKCEFFRHKNLICKNAIPMLQYGDHFRNNYCKLPPHKRDGDSKQGWKWLCPNAHCEGVEGRKCYAPKRRRKG